MIPPPPFNSPARYRDLVSTAMRDELRLGLPAGPPARVGLAAALLTVGVELMVQLAGGPRAASALLRLAESVERARLEPAAP